MAADTIPWSKVRYVVSELIEELFPLTSFLALAIYPAATFLGFSFNPVEFSWGSRLARRGQPFEPMPQALHDKADAVTRYLYFLVDALILGLIVVLLHRTALGAARVGLQFLDWKRNTVVGIAAGTLLVATQGLMLQQVPIDPRHSFTYQVRKGSPVLWVCIFITGAFSEELWIALCLVVLRSATHSAAVSVAMTVTVFAAMHYSYRFWGAVAVAAKGTVAALLFLHFGSLVVTFLYHFVGNLGSLYWNRYWHR